MWRSARAQAHGFVRRTYFTAGARASVSHVSGTHEAPSRFNPHRRSPQENEVRRTSPRSSRWAEVRLGSDSSGKELVQVDKCDPVLDPMPTEGQLTHKQIGDNVSRDEKIKFLLDLFSNLKDSKEAVYGALDAWVAWEREFPLPAIRRALDMLQKDEQWHRIIQVIKWMLSKGQGRTMGTYEQLIQALEKDYRAEEAHYIWVRKFGCNLHSAPWQVCELMISIYYRNGMLERLVKLFEGLEMFNRWPPQRSIVQKVADAYEMLALSEQRNRVIEKYKYLFEDPHQKLSRKVKKASEKKHKSDRCHSEFRGQTTLP